MSSLAVLESGESDGSVAPESPVSSLSTRDFGQPAPAARVARGSHGRSNSRGDMENVGVLPNPPMPGGIGGGPGPRPAGSLGKKRSSVRQRVMKMFGGSGSPRPAPGAAHDGYTTDEVLSEEDEMEGAEGDEASAAKSRRRRERRERLGHRKVDLQTGEVSFKQLKSAEIMGSIQIGLRIATGFTMQRKRRDVLYKDFDEVESLSYPREGTNLTPPHNYSSFKFYSYAPLAYRDFRKKFNIDTTDFLISLTNQPLRELSNPGASGSLFYLSHDDQYMIKTVQKGEHTFLRKLLPAYYMNLVQNKRTLLPKFFGHYVLRTSSGRAIRFVIMNNILPSHLTYAERYDLKGSTHGRKASDRELAKKNPTLKDLDFLDRNSHGLQMGADTYEKLVGTLNKDCLVLESFKIMDYSLLLGIHNPRRGKDRVVKSTRQMPPPAKKEVDGPRVEIIGLTTTIGAACCGVFHGQPLVGSERRRRYIKEKDSTMPRLVLLYDAEQSRWTLVAEEGTAGDVIGVIAYQATDSPSPVSDRDSSWFERAEEGDAFVEARECACLAADKVSGDRLSISFNDVMDQIDGEDVTQALPPRPKSPRAPSDKEIGGLVCYNSHGEKVHAFIGIIDILQNFGYKKKAEHTYKSLRWDGNTVSVHNPTFYSQRFQRFLGATVFRPDATSSKPAASDRKPASAARGRSFMRRVNANEASRSPTRRGATADALSQGGVSEEGILREPTGEPAMIDGSAPSTSPALKRIDSSAPSTSPALKTVTFPDVTVESPEPSLADDVAIDASAISLQMPGDAATGAPAVLGDVPSSATAAAKLAVGNGERGAESGNASDNGTAPARHEAEAAPTATKTLAGAPEEDEMV